jgi:hypothetical protein
MKLIMSKSCFEDNPWLSGVVAGQGLSWVETDVDGCNAVGAGPQPARLPTIIVQIKNLRKSWDTLHLPLTKNRS